MMNNSLEQLVTNNLHGVLPWFGVVVIIIMVWSIFWKGLALWHSARNFQPYWFVAFLIFNTAGILELIFLFGVLKLKLNDLFKKPSQLLQQ